VAAIKRGLEFSVRQGWHRRPTQPGSDEARERALDGGTHYTQTTGDLALRKLLLKMQRK